MLIGVRPDDGICAPIQMVCAKGLRVMQARLNPGQRTTLQVSDLSNFGYRNFGGTLAVRLCNSTGNAVLLEKQNTEPLPYLESQEQLTLSLNVPDTIPAGEYTVSLAGFTESGECFLLYTNGMPRITLLPLSNEEMGDSLSEARLGASEFEVFKLTSNPETLNVRVYELYNFSEETQCGYLGLEIITLNGEHAATVGSPAWVQRLEAQTVSSAPVTLSGSIENPLADGDYRMHVLFMPQGENASYKVPLYDWADPESSQQDFYFPVTVKGCEIIVNGIIFSSTPTGIKAASYQENDSYYSLQGHREDAPQRKGVYIRRGRKVLVK